MNWKQEARIVLESFGFAFVLVILIWAFMPSCAAPHGYVRAGGDSAERTTGRALVTLPMSRPMASGLARALPIAITATSEAPRVELFADGYHDGRLYGLADATALFPLLTFGGLTLELFGYARHDAALSRSRTVLVKGGKHYTSDSTEPEGDDSTGYGIQIRF